MQHTPTPSRHLFRGLLGIAMGAALAASAHAQGSSSTGMDTTRSSWLPYTHSGYIGLNAGRSNFSGSCGALALRCDDHDTLGKIYLGGYFHPNFGAELGYADLGDADRAGGRTSAQGLYFALVGRAPLGQNFSAFGKLGANYGRTRVSALPGSGVVAGRESGWGPTIGLGLSWDISRNWSAVLEWERTRYRFAGGDREGVSATSLGVRYNF